MFVFEPWSGFPIIGTIGIGYRFDQKAYRYIGIGIGSQKISIFYRNLPIISYRYLSVLSVPTDYLVRQI